MIKFQINSSDMIKLRVFESPWAWSYPKNLTEILLLSVFTYKQYSKL